MPVSLMVIANMIGFGLVVNTHASWLSWQGYLLGPFGVGGRTWASANLGVIVSLFIAFLGWLAFGRAVIRRQETTAPDTEVEPVGSPALDT